MNLLRSFLLFSRKCDIHSHRILLKLNFEHNAITVFERHVNLTNNIWKLKYSTPRHPRQNCFNGSFSTAFTSGFGLSLIVPIRYQRGYWIAISMRESCFVRLQREWLWRRTARWALGTE